MKLISSKTLFIVLAALPAALAVYAQNNEQAEQDKPLTNQDAQTESAEAETKARPPVAKPPKKTFKPSEEISEDSPVPFPVDI